MMEQYIKKMRSYLVLGFLAFIILSLGNICASAREKDFEVNALVIKSVINEGESVSNLVKIINYNKEQKFNIDYFSENNLIFVEPDIFLIRANEEKMFNVIFNSKDYPPGVYSGEIVVRGEKDSISIPTILEIETPSIDFDVLPEIAPSYSEVLPGGKFAVDIKVYNLKLGSKEVSLYYTIKDRKGDIILSESQDLDVLDDVQITKTFLLPEKIEPGNYVFSILAIGKNSGSVGTSSVLFDVALSLSPIAGRPSGYYLDLALAVIFVLIVSFLIINYYWNKRLVGNAVECNKRIIDIRKVKSGDISREIKKFEYKKSLLEIAYKKGYIKKEAYKEGKRRVDLLIEKLKKRM